MLSTDKYVEASTILSENFDAKAILTDEDYKAFEVAHTNIEGEWKDWLSNEYLPGYPERITSDVFIYAEIAAGSVDTDNVYAEIETRYKNLASMLTYPTPTV